MRLSTSRSARRYIAASSCIAASWGALVAGLITVGSTNAQATEPTVAAPTASPAPGPVSFELDVQPLLTRAGCNAGACHGKQRGQNGFQLSLFGFDSDFDYDAIVNSARGRRIFPAVPAASLLLQKATAELPHGVFLFSRQLTARSPLGSSKVLLEQLPTNPSC